MEQTFELTITGRECHTWQGRLCCGGGAIPFRSEMELLLALDRLIPATGLQAAIEGGEYPPVNIMRKGGGSDESQP